MYRSVCFHISYNKKYIWISIIAKRQNFMVTPHVHRERRYHWARDNVIDIYMVPIVYYVAFDQWTCTWAGVQKPRGWLTHRYSRQNLAYSHSLNQIHITRLPNWSRKRQYRKCTVWIAQLAAVYLLTTYPTITDVFQGFFWSAWLWQRTINSKSYLKARTAIVPLHRHCSSTPNQWNLVKYELPQLAF